MTRKIDLDEFKSKYIGKTFGWLTVLDVYKDTEKGRYYFKCVCKCGKEVCKQYNKVISGHTNSCGCFKFSKDYSDKLKSIWKDNPDKVAAKTKKFIQWCKENTDKVKEKSEKRKKTIEENPDILAKQLERRRETFKNHPEIQQTINQKLRDFWSDNSRVANLSDKVKSYFSEHRGVVDSRNEKIKKFYQDNPEKKLVLSDRAKQWAKDHPEEIAEQGKRHSEVLKERRLSIIQSTYNSDNSQFKQLLESIHPSQVDDLLNGNIKAGDIIETKCPVCGKYEGHPFNGTWRLLDGRFRTGRPPYCEQCRSELSTSSFEEDIAYYISTFYNGTLIRNSREIISPFELDLYYPDKRIAIEYNGSHWHDEDHKPKDYHYVKFKKCYDSNILLVSIFENDWKNKADYILLYLKDLFNDEVNDLSYKNIHTIDLNYPPPTIDFNKYSNLYSNYYISREKRIYMCGYASDTNFGDLQFLVDVAEENNLEYFINDKNDLEIKDKSICFHLADMLNGDKDAVERWQSYHDIGKRCVFIYPPYLKNINRVNVYKNILVYHCGLAKRIYARNTVVNVYPAVKMKKFFEENNIEGYRGAKKAYVLEDKKTGEPYMCYLIGHSYFGKGNYDCEIARGACKLGYQIIGGASKLWKHIINDNPDIKSIVYYCDRREYDQRSIGHLMDSSAMTDLGTVHQLKGGPSFMNYWINDTYVDGKLWHKSCDYANREPAKHALVMEAMRNGNCIAVTNPGSYTNIFVRSSYHLEGMKVVPDSN